MKFDNARSVSQAVYYMRESDIPRSSNRALINDLFNGNTPYSDQEAEENNINTNVNFLDASRIAHGARNTLNNGFLKPGKFFNVTLDTKIVHKRTEWSKIITTNINRVMKKSPAYMETMRSEFAQAILHGIGPSNWDSQYTWAPCPMGLDNFLVPARTRVSLDNLEYFAILRQYTPSKFYAMTHGKEVGWNKAAVNKVWKRYTDNVFQANQQLYQNWTPEQASEAFKEDLGFMDSDVVPTIDLWDFYFRNDESESEEWNRRMILDSTPGQSTDFEDSFIYEPKRTFATDLSQIIHVMFADGANVAPFRYHSVRGLGWLLYAVCQLQNRLRCKLNDHVFENLLMYFRVANPTDRERLDKLDLHHLGIIPEGLSIVPPSERNQINQVLANNMFTINNQSMSDSAAQFRSDPENSSGREMTAAEVMARVNASNALVGSMLNLAYNYQTYQYKEICRRISKGVDKDSKEVLKKCREDGVPDEMLNFERWDIEPERVLGAGNKTLEIAQAKELMAARPLYDPEPQREILHIFTEAMTDDPRMAERLVPIQKKIVSDSVHDAQLAAAALLMGLTVSIKTGMNHIEYIEAMLVSLGQKIKMIDQSGGMVSGAQEVMGLQNLISHLSNHIEILADDKNEKSRVKNYGDIIGNFSNMIKGFVQRWKEKMASEQQAQPDPETMTKMQGEILKAQTNAKIKEASAQQKLIHRQQSFEQKQIQSDQKTQAELAKQAVTTQADIQQQDARTAADITMSAIKQNATTKT